MNDHQSFGNLLYAALLLNAGARYIRTDFDDDSQMAVLDLSGLDRKLLKKNTIGVMGKALDEIPVDATAEDWDMHLDSSPLGGLDKKYRWLKRRGHREKQRMRKAAAAGDRYG